MPVPAVVALQNACAMKSSQAPQSSDSSSWHGRMIHWIIESLTLEVCKIILIVLKFLGYSEETLRFFRYIEEVEETITQEVHHFGSWPERYPEDPSRLVGDDPRTLIIAFAIDDLLRSVNGSISSLSEETRAIVKKISSRYDSLNLHGCQITIESLNELIAAFPDLEKLYLTHCNIDSMHLQALVQFKSLRHLSLEGIVTITDHLLPILNTFPALTSLDIAGCHGILKSESLILLEKIKKLKIGTSACFFGNGACEVAKLTQLESLDLTDSDHVSDGSVHELLPLTNLRSLNLSGTKITDHAFHTIIQFPNLRKVIIRNCNQITHKGYVHFIKTKPGRLNVILE